MPLADACSIRENLQKHGLIEHTTLGRHRKTTFCLILKLEGAECVECCT